MKPHLLMFLLMAIPPLLGNILASESAEKSDPAPVAEKAPSVPAKEIATPVSVPASTVAPHAAVPAAPSSIPASGSGNSKAFKAWYVM